MTRSYQEHKEAVKRFYSKYKIKVTGDSYASVELSSVFSKRRNIIPTVSTGTYSRALLDAVSLRGSPGPGGKVMAIRNNSLFPFSMHMGLRDLYAAPWSRTWDSGHYDITAFVRTAAREYSDLLTDITIITAPLLSMYASIFGFSTTSINLTAGINGVKSTYGVLYAGIKALHSTHTSPLEYDYTIVGTMGGLSIVRRLLTTLPDLSAYISGWESLDLLADISITSRTSNDLAAVISSVAGIFSSLYASVTCTYTEDIGGSVLSIEPSDIAGVLTTIPPYPIYGSLVTVPPLSLTAFAGGHLPADFYAYIYSSPAANIGALIRAGLSDSSDVATDITAAGFIDHLYGRINTLYSSSSSLRASLTPRVPVDIRAYIHSWDVFNLTASIIGVYSNDIGGYISGWKTEQIKDMVAFTRAAFDSVVDVPSSVYGWISTHTSDKVVNTSYFYPASTGFILSSPKGMSVLNIEPIWGVFPDLHADITARGFFRSELKGFVRANIASSTDLSATLNAVTRVVFINKIPINFVYMSQLYADISAYSAYSPMSASVRGVASVSTSTSPGASWVRTSSSIRFYLGLNKGLYVPSTITSSINSSYFINKSENPDLWAYTYGWDSLDILSSISVYPTSALYGSLTSQDVSHLSSLSAILYPLRTALLTASLIGVGGFNSVVASITPTGQTAPLYAEIRPYLKVLGFRVLTVETMPFLDMFAVINPASSCSLGSSYLSISSFIRPQISLYGGAVLYASIVSSRGSLDVEASITGRKLTRIRTINLFFRAKSRSYSDLSSFILGVSSVSNDLTAAINSVPTESDLSATITPYYPVIGVTNTLDPIEVYKNIKGNYSLYRRLKLTFSSYIDTYIYDSINNALYEIGDGRWVLNLKELTETGNFFDSSGNELNRDVDSLVEYDSLDEAIRAAIDLLTTLHNSDITASIEAKGGFGGIAAYITGDRADQVLSLPSSLFVVASEPVLAATVTAYGGYYQFRASVVGYSTNQPDLFANVYGVVYDSLTADITPTI